MLFQYHSATTDGLCQRARPELACGTSSASGSYRPSHRAGSTTKQTKFCMPTKKQICYLLNSLCIFLIVFCVVSRLPLLLLDKGEEAARRALIQLHMLGKHRSNCGIRHEAAFRALRHTEMPEKKLPQRLTQNATARSKISLLKLLSF